MAELVIEFSRAAPTEFFDRWILDRSKLICRLAHSPFSHGDYVLGPEYGHQAGFLLGASDSPHCPYALGDPRGVALRPPDYHQFALRHRARVPCTDIQKKHYEKFLFDQLGKPFDHDALRFRYFLSDRFDDRNWRADEAWYCHELLVRGYEVASVLPWKLIGIKNRITGGDHLLIINPLIDVDSFWVVFVQPGLRPPAALALPPGA